jgi:hypothetical protein
MGAQDRHELALLREWQRKQTPLSADCQGRSNFHRPSFGQRQHELAIRAFGILALKG